MRGVLALGGLAGLAVEDTALVLAAGCLAGQKLEGILVFGLHTQCCFAARILHNINLFRFRTRF